MLDGLDIIIMKGNRKDVQQVTKMIEDIEKLSQETEPEIVVHPLNHTNSAAMGTLINQIYMDVFYARQGPVSVTALIKPNSLLLIGRKESVERVVKLVQQLDVPVPPEAKFQIFHLKWASATTVQTIIQSSYAATVGTGAPTGGGFGGQAGAVPQSGLSPIVRATADVRTNSVIVQAGPRDMAEVASMIARLDVQKIDSVNELRIFPLQHALSADVVQVLQDAISAQLGMATSRPTTPGATPGGFAGATTPGAAGSQPTRNAMLQFLAIDVQGQRKLDSGVLNDVHLTSNPSANTILVAGPVETMPLIEALIKQLDMPPTMRAEIKVFTVVNADASALSTLLTTLFGQPTTTAGAGTTSSTTPPAPSAAGQNENSLVPLRFSPDARTNSIIATGSRTDLVVVEAILLRLDATDIRKWKSTVYQLRNAPAPAVAQAITTWLSQQYQIETTTSGLLSPFEQIEREVVVVAEPVTNTLIVSTTSRFYNEVLRMVEDSISGLRW